MDGFVWHHACLIYQYGIAAVLNVEPHSALAYDHLESIVTIYFICQEGHVLSVKVVLMVKLREYTRETRG